MAMAAESRKLVRNIIVEGLNQHTREHDIVEAEGSRPAAHDVREPASIIKMTF